MPRRAQRREQRRRQVEHHLTTGKACGALGDQPQRIVGLQVHQQPFGGDEHAVLGVDLGPSS